MTIQFSKQPMAVLSDGLPKMGSCLVCRVVCARDDPGKERIRMWLIDLDDAQLRSGLGLTVEDIAVQRTGTKTASPLRQEKRFWENTMSNEGRVQTCKAWRAGVNPAQHRIVDARTSRMPKPTRVGSAIPRASAVRCVRRA